MYTICLVFCREWKLRKKNAIWKLTKIVAKRSLKVAQRVLNGISCQIHLKMLKNSIYDRKFNFNFLTYIRLKSFFKIKNRKKIHLKFLFFFSKLFTGDTHNYWLFCVSNFWTFYYKILSKNQFFPFFTC